MNNILQHRANAAIASIDNARTPHEKAIAEREAFAVKADLEKQLGDDKALAVFKAGKPQSSAGVWSGSPRIIFMIRADGTKPAASVALPNGSSVVPIQGQIPVPENLVAAMISQGWKRSNDVITPLSTTAASNPTHLNTVGAGS